jgi:hexokinase
MEDNVSWNILLEIARRQFQRATTVIALSLAAMIEANAETFSEATIDIPYTGSTFELTPGFQQEVEKIMKAVLPQYTIRFVKVPGSIGAAFLAEREYAKKYRSG